MVAAGVATATAPPPDITVANLDCPAAITSLTSFPLRDLTTRLASSKSTLRPTLPENI